MLYVSFEVSEEFLLFDASSLEIEVIAGSAFGLEIPFSDKNAVASRLRLCISDDSRAYTLRNLLSELSSGYEQLEEAIWDRKTGRLLGNTLIILNGTYIDLLAGLDTTIRVGDLVVFLPFIAGG